MLHALKHVISGMIYGHKATSDRYVAWLRKQGVRIGSHVHLYTPWSIKIDTQRPWMIEIGNNVHITADCSILQHDYSWSVIQHLTGEVLGACGKVHIGNNVFIGQKTVVLRGTEIGDNTIIGAGSVVVGRLEGNAVYAGVPARKISNLDTFIAKRRTQQIIEATQLVEEYKAVYKQFPSKEILREFFWLFEQRASNVALNPVFQKVHELDDNKERSTQAFMKSHPQFDNYESFLAYIKEHDNSNIV
ncbi:acyltransferase [Bifidobacterium oedipodis]|uniref:Acetyltransferase (Cell wall biosynthesis) n=1 Tax=Bifidobacterium oedipodis TaxID=2675322 RepID=A0A7Y0ERS9_9BIFI|nr:acyltransferase [Bifidobacterium sp. DSM 109957]NMM95240.1 acetyltransferase (cell wall biosynthesis) [Bifidobacterium sp. DSM 109957]